MKTILFVCSGNTCRSPMAELLCRRKLAQAGLGENYETASAGLFAGPGGPSPHAVEVMNEEGLDLSGHRTRQLSQEPAAQAWRIYTMSADLARLTEDLIPAARGKTFPLCTDGIDDPYGGDTETYRRCAQQIDRALDGIVGGLK